MLCKVDEQKKKKLTYILKNIIPQEMRMTLDEYNTHMRYLSLRLDKQKKDIRQRINELGRSPTQNMLEKENEKELLHSDIFQDLIDDYNTNVKDDKTNIYLCQYFFYYKEVEEERCKKNKRIRRDYDKFNINLTNTNGFCFMIKPEENIKHFISCFCDLKNSKIYLFDPYGGSKEQHKHVINYILLYLKHKNINKKFDTIYNLEKYKLQKEKDVVNCGPYAYMFLEYVLKNFNTQNNNDLLNLFMNETHDPLKWRIEKRAVLEKYYLSRLENTMETDEMLLYSY